MQVKFPHALKRNSKKKQQESVLNFKRELRILNELEHLIDTITAADNPECSFMISNQHFACNLVFPHQ